MDVPVLLTEAHCPTLANPSPLNLAIDAQGNIAAIGSGQDFVQQFNAQKTISVQGKYVYPGFMDAHCHLLRAAEYSAQLNASNCTSFSELLHQLQEKAQQLPPTEPLLAYNYDATNWSDMPTMPIISLSEHFPNRPVLVLRVDLHQAIINNFVLKSAFKNPNAIISGGAIEKIGGCASGIILDNAISIAKSQLPPPNKSLQKQHLLAIQQHALQSGLTSVGEAYVSMQDLALLQNITQQADWQLPLYGMLDGTDPACVDWLQTHAPYKTEWLHFNALKYFADGALGSYGAWLLHPYSDKPSTKGIKMHTTAYLLEMAQLCAKHNLQMVTHAIGDAAARQVLQVYSQTLQANNTRRWRLEHCQLVSAADFNTFGQYNIIPSVQTRHCTTDMRWLQQRIGTAREAMANKHQSLWQQNGFLINGTDYPVEPLCPIKTFYAAVSRKNEDGLPENGYYTHEALSRKQALAAITTHTAYAQFQENEKGSLSPGKQANLSILNKNLLNCPEADILNTTVEQVWVKGNRCV